VLDNSPPVSTHPLLRWGVNSTLSDIYQLDEPPGQHSAEEEALDTAELGRSDTVGFIPHKCKGCPIFVTFGEDDLKALSPG
jgi:hypothetical protein